MKLEDEILISAYLDGEVSSDEKLRAEQLLAGSADARQLADELRAVRTRLQDLPRLGLPANFADQTLRRAEQELAAANAVDSAVTSSHAVARQQTGSFVQPTSSSVWTSWRGIAWAAVALAAAIMILVTNRPASEKHQELAKNQTQSTQSTDNQVPQIADDSIRGGGTGGLSNPATAPGNQLVTDRVNETPLSPAVRANDLAADQRNVQSFSATAEGQKMVSPGESATAVKVEGVSRGEHDVSVNNLIAADDGVLSVRLDITPEAAHQREFDRLLAKHSITVDDQSSAVKQDATVKQDAEQSRDSPATNSLDAIQQEATPAGKLSRQASKKSAPDLESWLPGLESGKKLDVIYVEASPEQLASAIDELVTQNQWFSSVAVAKSLPIQKSSTQPKNAETARPSASVSVLPQPDVVDENNAASELLSPRPSEKTQASETQVDTSSIANTEAKSAAGRAIRLNMPAEKRAGAPPQASTAKSSSTEQDKASSAEINKTDGKSESSALKQAPPKLAIFVLRIVEPTNSPSSAAPPR